ncbi:MAG: bifunctional UDP-N-acetylglucosamine diphosphorylase/glucosamine-1-phosphate N-acetyltransferase GlmU [Acidobacteriales bacterium]|nr:bifunctional UDP-N-acetylglucosamine diphosphorylase/glucosamine-1-phosphate N-acetyltransferase GlmU [Terriglobales bacterium]
MSKSPARRVSDPRVAIAILAAGKGTRLKSKAPKVLHEVGGKPLLAHVIAAAAQVVPVEDVFAIVGHQASRVQDAVGNTGVRFVIQAEQRGTGHALMAAQEALAGYDVVIVLSGDAPLITSATIEKLRDFHVSNNAAMTVLAAELADPTNYGRVIRKGSKSAEIAAIVEEKSASLEQRRIREINSGIYAFSVKPLYANIDRLESENPHREFYLTDMAKILAKAKQRVLSIAAADASEVLGANTRSELADIDRNLRMSKCQSLMESGVTIFYPETCVIDGDAEIGADTIIEPFVQILGATRVGSDCRIGSYSVIRNSRIGDGVVIRPGCVLEQASVENIAILGPYSHLRSGSHIGEGAHVGNFVETKNVRLGKRSKANHLTYLGDAEIGEAVNVGAGTITCNYDGVHKHKTVIDDGAFIGSDSTLVAPVRVGKRSYVGAASCVTEDVPDDSLAVGRARQILKPGWAKDKRERQAKQKKEESAAK